MNKVDPAQSVIIGSTRLYAIIGDPIAQVGSPRVFNPIMARSGVDAVLVPMRVAAKDLATAWAGLKAIGNFDGVIFTIPHKIPMTKLVDTVLTTGKLVGAVNAARREKDGRWTADMFDGRGCVRGLRDTLGFDPDGKSALVVGAGGAGSAVACALAEAGARRMTIADTVGARAGRLARVVTGTYTATAAQTGAADPKGHDLIVNCTPLGMKPDDLLPLDAGALKKSMTVVDIVLLPEPSKLLAAATAKGCQVMNGLAMLKGQAMEVSRFFGFA